LIAGGPPCQGFSVNAPVRSNEDSRNHLFKDFLRFVKEFQPKAVLIENVPGMLSYEKGATVLAILEALRELGYAADVRVLFAANYGVPQARWRTIIMANRLGINPLRMYPNPTHNAEGRANFATTLMGQKVVLDKQSVAQFSTKKYITVWDAISDLPEIENGGGEREMNYGSTPRSDFQRTLRGNATSVFNHQSSSLGKTNLQRLPHIPMGGSWRDIPFELLPKGMQRARRSDHTKRYGRLHPEQLGSTILTKCDPHWGTYIHPNQERVLSVREAARIQSFPDWTIFEGNITEQYEQVGNAVPPLFAKALGEQIANVLFDTKEEQTNSAWLTGQLHMALSNKK
jgi:DNA (cytosine-5)-methyltransferase 1